METTTAPTSNSCSWSCWSSRIANAGQDFTHSWHSEHTPQSRQEPAPLRACASVSGASISVKSRGSLVRVTSPLTGWRWPKAVWRASTVSAEMVSSRSSRAVNPSSGWSVSQRSTMCAARRPEPMARVMSVAPAVTSPAANRNGIEVCSVFGSTVIRPRLSARAAKGFGSGLMPMVEITRSQSRTYSLPGMGSGLRRPDASGAPSCIRWRRTPVTLPSRVTTSVGATSNSKTAPSASASLLSTWCAGISARVRR